MKTILLPTDFSDNARNALKFGLNIAKTLKAEVVFFHSNHVPVIAPNTPVGVYDNLITIDEEKQKASLEELREQVHQETGISQEEVPSSSMIRMGFAVDEIINAAEEVNAGMIVMGTEGASGLQKTFIGTNAASILKRAPCPVFTIPANSVFSGINKIVFATDFHNAADRKVLNPLLELAYLFDAEILIFNVRNEKEKVPSYEEAFEGLKVEESLKTINHSYHFSDNEDIIEGIRDFIRESGAEVLAMLPHKHGFFEGLFSKSYTEEIALQAIIPLFTIPEKEK